jgi:hypothetical protein
LRELIAWQLQPKRTQTVGEAAVEELEIVDTNVEELRFDDEVLEGCEKVLADLDGVMRLSTLLDLLEADRCPDAIQDAVVLRILDRFDPEDEQSAAPLNIQIAEVDGLRTPRCAGDDLLIDASTSDIGREVNGQP